MPVLRAWREFPANSVASTTKGMSGLVDGGRMVPRRDEARR